MPKIKKILVVGGSGYIGSHMTALLVSQKYHPVVFDRIVKRPQQKLPKAKYIQGDLCRYEQIRSAMLKEKPDLVMYFAGLIVAPESNIKPIPYLDNNVLAAVNLLKAMDEAGVKKIIFSSTAAVYGNPSRVPITEDIPEAPINTYGFTKLMFEQMLKRVAIADKNFQYIILRYFNAAGAHQSGDIGEDHHPETHLIPNVLRTIKGKHKELVVYGDNYPTKDGTCIRDYIHVDDLVEAHYLSIKAIDQNKANQTFNLGSGSGYSVKEVIKAAEEVTQKMVKVKKAPRRPGDPAKLIASSAKARKVLGWTVKHNLHSIMRSAWAWEKKLK
jgi:UDP-glucose 4-epimerase